MTIFETFFFMANSEQLLFGVMTFSFFTKIYLLTSLIFQGISSDKKIQKPWLFLIGILIGSAVGDISWVIKYLRIFFIPSIPYNWVVFCARIAFALLILQYQSLALLIQNIRNSAYKLRWAQKLLFYLGFVFQLYFLFIAFFGKDLVIESERLPALLETVSLSSPFEICMIHWYVPLYLFPVVLIPLVSVFFSSDKSQKLPKILRKQIDVLALFIVPPFLLLEFLIAFKQITFNNITISLSTILITYTIFYCIKTILPLRFLNITSHVESKRKLNFINDFTDIIEQLVQACTVEELTHITQHFFKNSLGVPLGNTHLHMQITGSSVAQGEKEANLTSKKIVTFIENDSNTLHAFLQQEKIFIYDEIEFDHHCQQSILHAKAIHFLNEIDADIFLPIYQNNKIIACVTVEKNSLPNELYGDVQRDEMLIFSNYLNNMINLIRTNSLEAIAQERKMLEDELHDKHQEIKQYKESIHSFLRNGTNNIGILFYKNRRFTCANQAAKEMVSINLNVQVGHPFTKEIKDVAEKVEKYKMPKTAFATDESGRELIISGVCNVEQNNVIVTVHYPEVSDIIKRKMDRLKDPSRRDFLLYLETTESGKLLNKLLPGSSEILLNLKIDILKVALSKKATLLELPQEDLLSTVEIVHHVGLRDNLHSITLNEPCTDNSIALKLFGINDLFNTGSIKPALLKTLNFNGTLFIENVNYLGHAAQERLLEYIRRGYFRPLQSEQRITSNARIICSSNTNLQHLVQEGTFSRKLLDELKKMPLSMSSLDSLSEEKFHNLADEFAHEVLKDSEFKNLLTLTKHEKNKIIRDQLTSLKHLKKRIQHIVRTKADKKIQHETSTKIAYTAADPGLEEASKLGKNALRDKNIMKLLWEKLKTQNKIATFLGVNRSSVSRRCREYDLS